MKVAFTLTLSDNSRLCSKGYDFSKLKKKINPTFSRRSGITEGRNMYVISCRFIGEKLTFGDHPSNWVPLEVKLDVHVLALGQHAMYNHALELCHTYKS